MLSLRAVLAAMLVLDAILCLCGTRVEDTSTYRACIGDTSGCSQLYAARPSTRSGERVRGSSREMLSVPERVGGVGVIWGRRILGSQGLTGTLPTALGLLTALTIMILNGNAITGTMPTELGRMRLMEGM